jgi:hypothetical protein
MFGNNYRPPSSGGGSGFGADPLDDYLRRHDPLYPFSSQWDRDQQQLMAEDQYLRHHEQYLQPPPYYPPYTPPAYDDEDEFKDYVDPWEDWDGPYWE